MNLFSAAHLAIAGLCAMMGALHLVMWWAVRTEPAHKWVALSFAGFTLLNLGIAGSSVAAEASLGNPRWWLLASAPTALLLTPALVRTAWAVFDWPMTPLRRRVLIATVLSMVPMAVQFTWYVLTDSPHARSWEEARYADPWVALPYQVGMLMTGIVWLESSGRAIRSMPVPAWTALVAVAPTLGLVVREGMLAADVISGPTLIGVMGLPLGAFASVSLVARYIRVVKNSQALQPRSGEYRQLARLGAGGMGELWLALRSGEAGFRRWVVIKRIRMDKVDADMVDRFLVEARIAARLHHPNIVAVYDLDHLDENWTIVMEYLAGPSVWEVLARCYEEETFAPIGVVAAITEQICQGLQCAHEHGVLHRDISPDNVIVTFDGVAKILDFGIAKEEGTAERAFTGSFADDGTTLTGAIVGKAQYLAPERTVGEPSTPQSDIYALGLVMVQLLGAPIPERGAELAGHPRPVSEHRPDVPASVEAICKKALAAHPKQRYRSAAEMADDLRVLVSEHGPVDLAGWTRTLCPRRFSVQKRLGELLDPTPAQVGELFAELAASEPIARSGDGDTTSPDEPETDPGPKAAKTTVLVSRQAKL